MDSLWFALNAVSPIILTVAIGYLLRRTGLMSEDFARAGNKLVFHLFLPVTLFLNIFKIDVEKGVEIGYILYAVAAILVIFFLAIPLVMLVTRHPDRRGPLLQVSFRSNMALIGIPLAEALGGESGIAATALISAPIVPLFNALAVVSLSIFRGGKRPSVKKILLDIVKNPLIQSIAAGLVALLLRQMFENRGVSFSLSDLGPIYTVLNYLSAMSTPLALLVLGARFEFSAVKNLGREIVFGTLMRALVTPLLGLGMAYLLFGDVFDAAQFATLVSLFATPVAISSAPMAQEMDNDTTLAGQLVVWTAIASAFTIFLSAYLLRLAGVFA